MAFLTSRDYNKQIQADAQAQIINSDSYVLADAELAAVEEMRSYLAHRYDATKIFSDVHSYDHSQAYKVGDRVYVTAASWSASTNYVSGNMALKSGVVYRCISDHINQSPPNATYWAVVGNEGYYYAVPLDWSSGTSYSTDALVKKGGIVYQALQASTNKNPTDDTDEEYWSGIAKVGEFYDLVLWTGQYPADLTRWAAGDIRNKQVVLYVVDIALYHVHSRINPKNIPELRLERYDNAKGWGKMAARGEITANLPLIEPEQGSSITYGNNYEKRDNFY